MRSKPRSARPAANFLENIGDGSLARAIHHVVERHRLASELSESRRSRAEAEKHLHRQIHRLIAARDASNRLIDAGAESRTPLTVVQEYCSLVRDGLAGPVTDEQRQYLGIAMGRVGDLGSLLSDFVDATWLDSGTHRLRPKPVRLIDVVDRLEAALLSKAATGHIRIEFRVSRDLPDVYCDPDVIGRVIAGLTNQAIRPACDEGVVRIWAEPVPDQGKWWLSWPICRPGRAHAHRTHSSSGGNLLRRRLREIRPRLLQHRNGQNFGSPSLSELRMQRNGDQGTAYFSDWPKPILKR